MTLVLRLLRGDCVKDSGAHLLPFLGGGGGRVIVVIRSVDSWLVIRNSLTVRKPKAR